MPPDFSPAMLRFFLHARVSHAGLVAVPLCSPLPSGQRPHEAKAPAERRMKDSIRKTAGITNLEFQSAWLGRLPTPDPRAKLWGALGLIPASFGVRLTHGGQEHIHEGGEA